MPEVISFGPVIGHKPQVLILGSIPGVISLQNSQYYGHPRNLFWPIMAGRFDIEIYEGYERRIQEVARLPIVLWDTIKACYREGSLDSSIQKQQLEANGIPALLDRYRQIQTIVFNGVAAEKYFKQLLQPKATIDRNLKYIRMPSTSPANASMGFEQKLECWRELLNYMSFE